eukprot:IDg22785t1
MLSPATHALWRECQTQPCNMPGCLRCHARHLVTELTADSYPVTAGCTDSTTSIPLLQFPWRKAEQNINPALATIPARPTRCSLGRASGRAR